MIATIGETATYLYNKYYTISDHPNSVSVRKELCKDRCKIHCLGIIEERLNFREQANKYNNARIEFWNNVLDAIEKK